MGSLSCQSLERHLGALTNDVPFRGNQVGYRAGTVLRPGTPATGRLVDRLTPVTKSPRRPVADSGEDVAESLSACEHHIREGEYIGGPFQKPVGDGGSAGGMPDRSGSWLAHAFVDPAVGCFSGRVASSCACTFPAESAVGGSSCPVPALVALQRLSGGRSPPGFRESIVARNLSGGRGLEGPCPGAGLDTFIVRI